MKSNRLKLIVALIAFVGLVGVGWVASVPWTLAQNQESSINDLKRSPEKYVNKTIVVRGRLRLMGRNYFTDPRFALTDEAGNQIPVTIWAPLEVPPPIPGSEELFKNKPKVMGDYLDRKLSITGSFRFDPAKGEKSIEVEFVVEDEEQ